MSQDTELRNQRILQRFVEREVVQCVSSLVHHFASNPDSLAGSGYSWEDDVLPLCSRDDWQAAAEYWIGDADADALAEAADFCLPGADPEDVQADALREAIREIESDDCDADCVSPYAEACEALNGGACGFIAEGTPAAEAGRRVAKALRTAILDALDDATIDELSDAVNALLLDPDAGKICAEALRKPLGEWASEDDDNARELCDYVGTDPEQREAFEHWIVSDWLAGKLAEQGELTGELFGLTIWGRTCSGQGIACDGVIREIASELEILAGQRNDWSKEGGEQC